ncbi:MAG: glycine--tRNA ligase subunit beta [Oscillatoria sp. SIO1A7]|nr:glycine--tRNA ligase subunit beta [Oscillatoria sp. SIO1A7]
MKTFLFELGTEELPADFVGSAIAQWQSLIPKSLGENLLTSETIRVLGSPRRLAVLIAGLPERAEDREEEIKGPPAKAAFKDGQPTKAALGFAKKQGIELEALEIRPTPKGDFVFAKKKNIGRATATILAELVPEWIAKLEGKRFMRWGDGDFRFSRPVRWLAALLDKEIVPVKLENGSETIQSDRLSRGHRVLHPEPISIPQADLYIEKLREAYIETDPLRRQETIQEQVISAAEKIAGFARISPNLLAEVTNLVEWPTAVVGKFDEEFLILPPEVITTVTSVHQRYFPIFKSGEETSELLPYFITVANGDPAKFDIIAAGNERVIRARLADAQFFYKADIAKSLESYVAALEKVTFQEKLGSVREKVERLSKIASFIWEQLELSEAERSQIERAALLCKADLVTQMVYEFPELQGVMGSKYARTSGEGEAVATAIFEHYLPRGEGDRLPETLTGQAVGLADRLDTLVGIFGLGMLPSGSSDPFALRRAANAIVNIIWAADLPLNLHQLIERSAAEFTASFAKAAPELRSQLNDFFLQRVRTLLVEERSIDYDLVNAVLGEDDPEYTERALKDLLDVRDRALFLQSIRNDSTLDQIYETVNRSTRLAKQGTLDTKTLEPSAVVEPAHFQKSCEQAFYDALLELVPKTQAAREQRDYQKLVAALAEIAPTVSTFFDGADSVLVMDPNPEIQSNRLNLLGLLRNHARVLADFGPIVKG